MGLVHTKLLLGEGMLPQCHVRPEFSAVLLYSVDKRLCRPEAKGIILKYKLRLVS